MCALVADHRGGDDRSEPELPRLGQRVDADVEPFRRFATARTRSSRARLRRTRSRSCHACAPTRARRPAPPAAGHRQQRRTFIIRQHLSVQQHRGSVRARGADPSVPAFGPRAQRGSALQQLHANVATWLRASTSRATTMRPPRARTQQRTRRPERLSPALRDTSDAARTPRPNAAHRAGLVHFF